MEFHANVPVGSFKIFSATLDLFSNLSELVSIDVLNQQFVMSSINHSRTAQGLVRISPRFFEDYKLLRKGSKETSMHCTVSIKNFNSMFKKNVGNNNSIKMIQISITQGSVDNEQHTEARIHLKLVYNNKVSKKSNICYTDGDKIAALYRSDNMHNFVMSPSVLKGCLEKFPPKVTDIVFECTPHTLSLRSYWDEHITSSERPVLTSYTFSSNDCYAYSVIESVKVVCNLKEFRAYIDFIDYIEDNVHCSFEEVGKPVLFTFRFDNTIMLDLALMTQNDGNENTGGDINMDEFTIDSISTSDIFDQTPPPRAPSSSSSRSQQRRAPTSSSSRPSRPRNQQASKSTDEPPAAQPSRTTGVANPENINVSRYPPSTRSTGSRTTQPILSSGKSSGAGSETTEPLISSGRSNASGSHRSTSSKNDSLPTVPADDEEDEEPLFRRNPAIRPIEPAEELDISSKKSSKVTPTGQRLTTLQHLRLKHQMRNASTNSNNPDATTQNRREETYSRHSYPVNDESDEERDLIISRMKYEDNEVIPGRGEESRKRRHLVHKDSL